MTRTVAGEMLLGNSEKEKLRRVVMQAHGGEWSQDAAAGQGEEGKIIEGQNDSVLIDVLASMFLPPIFLPFPWQWR